MSRRQLALLGLWLGLAVLLLAGRIAQAQIPGIPHYDVERACEFRGGPACIATEQQAYNWLHRWWSDLRPAHRRECLALPTAAAPLRYFYIATCARARLRVQRQFQDAFRP